MALRGVKPRAIDKRLKALFFGEAGAGKTMAAIQFPRPYLVDTERGAENDEYTRILEAGGGAYFPTNDFNEMVREVKALISEKHDYKTLIIDPITTVYDDLIEKAEAKVGSEFGRHYGEAKKQWKRLANLLARVDLNVIVTSHQKNLYGGEMKLMGKTFDGPKGLDHVFDLVFEVQRRGKERVGVVQKTRCSGFPDGDVFPFSYEEIAQRYGREVLERQAVPVQFATKEQVEELEALLKVRVDAEKLQDKWLTHAGAESFSDMSTEQVTACITHLKGKDAATAAA